MQRSPVGDQNNSSSVGWEKTPKVSRSEIPESGTISKKTAVKKHSGEIIHNEQGLDDARSF